MKKQTLIVLLFIIILVSLSYAVYRSLSERVIITQNNVQTVYGEPQHGLIFGLCFLSGMCILGIVALILDRRFNTIDKEEEYTTLKKKLL